MGNKPVGVDDTTSLFPTRVMTALQNLFVSKLDGLDQFEGVDVAGDGHSYGLANVAGTNLPRRNWFGRVVSRIYAPSYKINNVGGVQASEVAGITAANAVLGTRQLVLWDATINDVMRSSGASNGLSGYAAAVQTYLRIRRAGAKWEAEAAATISGAWSGVSDSYSSGGVIQRTTAQNASHSYAVSGATSWTVLLGGGVTGTSMGTAVIAVDGTTVATVPLSGIYAPTGNNPSRTWYPYGVAVTTPDTGSHTITVTKSDATTNPVYSDALLVASTAPPMIVMNKAVYLTAAAFSTYNATGGSAPTAATVDQFNNQLVTTVNSIATDGTIAVIDPQAAGFNNARMMAPDGLHPSDYGAAFIASVAMRALRSVTAFVPGVGYGVPATQPGNVAAPSGATVYAADNFNRADGAPGTTSTGAKTWQTPSGTTYTISSNRVSGTSINDGSAPGDLYVDTGASDGTVQAVIGSVANFAGLLLRASGTNNVNGYVFWVNGGNYQLSKRTAIGSYTQVGTSSGVTPAANDTLTVVMNGSSFVCKVNGTTVFTINDTSYTGTRHGLWTYNASTPFDDFVANSSLT